MFRSILIVLAAGLSLNVATPVRGQSAASGPITSAEARRYGLEPAWTTRVELDPARGRLVHLQYFISGRNSYTDYVVQYGEGDRRRVFSEREVDHLGELLGKERAEKAAQAFVKQLEARGIEGKLSSQIVPEICLYAVTDRGMVHAIDAESGRTLWATVVGRRDYPTERPDANEDYLAVLNGSSLYLLTRATGELVWVRQIHGVPAAGPGISPSYVVVPTYTGNVEVYDIEDTRRLPEMYMSNGRALIQPTVTARSIVWPTDRGMLYVTPADNHGIRYRLEAKNTIVAPASFFTPNQLFVASIDGYVYCLHEISGDELWRFSAGEGIATTPVPTADTVFVVSEAMNMYAINRETGELRWTAPYVKRFIACSKDRLYCLGMADRPEILDIKTGGRIAILEPTLLDIYYPNLQTDRILVGTHSGVLQCLREIGQRWPLIHAGLPEAEQPKRPAIKQEGLPAAQPKPAVKPPAAGDDPFGPAGASDPFGVGPAGAGGAGEAGAGGGADPFGAGGADPFGAGASDAGGAGDAGDADPFGAGAAGGADPFGAGAAPAPAAGAGGADPFGP